jgi:hypothetical protein
MLIKSLSEQANISLNLWYEAVGSNPYHFDSPVFGWVHQDGQVAERLIIVSLFNNTPD